MESGTPELKPPTRHQQKVLDFIKKSMRVTGRFPTIREIAIAMGNEANATAGVRGTMAALVKRGILTHEGHRWGIAQRGPEYCEIAAQLKELIEWNDLIGKSQDGIWKRARELAMQLI